MPGHIVIGDGPRVRTAYRVLSVTKARSKMPGLGVSTYRLMVETMSAVAGRQEIELLGCYWSLVWDRRPRS